jgi:hypothetical protein
VEGCVAEDSRRPHVGEAKVEGRSLVLLRKAKSREESITVTEEPPRSRPR